MASLTLKNIPEDLLRKLRAASERDRRSMNQQILFLLEASFDRRPKAAASMDAHAQVAAWRKLAGKWESDVDLATETARIVGARSRGRKVNL